MIIRLLTAILLFSVSTHASGQLTLKEKVDLLYEVSPNIPSSEMVEELSEFIEGLRKYDKLSDKKRIKKIFADTKNEYLKRYFLYSFFSDIKIHTSYNCVTGSALFAIIFDELNIPYKVVEVPRHVYLVAFPGTLDYGIESTVTEEGVYNWTENNKAEIIDFLVRAEEVSESEVRLKGVDRILEEFFHREITEGFESLIGMHFFNYALLQQEKKKYADALHYLDRSESFGINQRSKMIKGGVLARLIKETEMDDPMISEYVVRFYNVVESKAQKKLTLSTFNYIASDALVTRRDQAFVDTAEANIHRWTKSEEDRNKLLSCVDRARSVWHYNRRQYDKSLEYAKQGYARNPENKEFEDLIGALIVNEIFDLFEEDDFAIGFVDTIHVYEGRYPFLREIPDYVNDLAVTYSILISAAYYYSDLDVSVIEPCVTELEKLSNHPELNTEDVYPQIGSAYGDISTYYFRNEQYDVALKWIKLALKFDEESESLQRKKGYIEEKM